MSGDIVERLWWDNDFAVFTADDGYPGLRLMSEADRRQEAADEIKRLRAAGDALADALAWWGKGNDAGDAALAAYREARRER